MRVTPDGRYVLAAAGPGAIVLDAAAAISGAPRAVLGALTAPARVAGAGPGAAEVAVSAGSRYAFVTLEGAGRIAVFDLRAAAATGFSDSGYLGAVPVGAGALGLATAPGGRLLYEVSESSRAPGSRTRGVLNVVDLRRALTAPAAAVIAAAPAPCAPVRVAVAPDGTRVWVTARDGNALLGFSAGALRAAPARALTSVTPVGAAPLGLVAVGTRVLVADADLGHTPGARSALSVLDVSDPTAPRLLGEVGIAALADAVAATSDGRRALLTASGGDALESLLLP
jgi:DNA-binding beta-propeller fold protein YncE